MGDRHGLPGREGGELRRVGQTASCRVRHERSLMRLTHADLTADPGTADVERVTRAGVARPHLLEEVQDVFGADGGPLREQPVVLVRQRSAAADGDQSGVTLGWRERATRGNVCRSRAWHQQGPKVPSGAIAAEMI